MKSDSLNLPMIKKQNGVATFSNSAHQSSSNLPGANLVGQSVSGAAKSIAQAAALIASNSIQSSIKMIDKSFKQRSKDFQIVSDFQNKLKLAEELIGKLAYNLREIQAGRTVQKKSRSPRARVVQMFNSNPTLLK